MRHEQLKRRISVVKETEKIVTAMQAIASSKMRKCTALMDSSNKYMQSIEDVVYMLYPSKKDNDKCFIATPSDKVAYIAIAGDSGLCGDFNHSILHSISKDIIEKDIKTLFAIGKLTREHCKGSSFIVDDSFIDLAQNLDSERIRAFASAIRSRFESGEFDSIQLAYTDSTNVVLQKFSVSQILPIVPQENLKISDVETEILCDKEDIESIIDSYLVAKLYNAICSSILAMNYKKLVTMRQASSNSSEMLEQLNKQYNHERQEKITSELLDSAISLQGKKL